jgi:hypothetical protein
MLVLWNPGFEGLGISIVSGGTATQGFGITGVCFVIIGCRLILLMEREI